ncbi:unnamed protein product [Caenorhabditis sp. 36 PRJEB53466]|nr:unnamed protein product [Caenorhabditis sp. 36 PRJEB53466]
MSELSEDEQSLQALFDPAKRVASDIEENRFELRKLQPRLQTAIANLHQVTVNVNKLGLFSSNEQIEDIPTSSLPFLMVPCFLGLFHTNLIVDSTEKLEELRKAKVYFRNYLERLRNVGLITSRLPWDDDVAKEDAEKLKAPKPSHEEIRKQKLDRHRRKKELKATELSIERQLEAVTVDEQNLRELFVTQLLFWSERAYEELQSIEEELPILRMMAERSGGHAPPLPPPTHKVPSLKPFVITRDAQQKKVFGAGYPGIPTVSVDEWFHQKFGCGGANVPPQSSAPPPTQQIQEGGGAGESVEEEEEEDEDVARAAAMREMAFRKRRHDSGGDSDEERLPINRDDDDEQLKADPAKKSRNLWSDMLLEEQLQEQGQKINLDKSAKKQPTFSRGPESYVMPQEEFQRKNQKNAKKAERDGPPIVMVTPAADDPFADAPEAPTEEFGVKKNEIKRNSVEIEQEKGWWAKKGANKRFAERGGHFDREKRHPAPVKKTCQLMAEEFSLAAMLEAKFEEDIGLEQLGTEMATAMGEKDPGTIVKIVNAIGRDPSVKLFEETKEIEKNGGMKTADGSRRRTPGGVFITLFKMDPTVSRDVKNAIFGDMRNADKQRSKTKKKGQQFTRQLEEMKKTMELAEKAENDLANEELGMGAFDEEVANII